MEPKSFCGYGSGDSLVLTLSCPDPLLYCQLQDFLDIQFREIYYEKYYGGGGVGDEVLIAALVKIEKEERKKGEDSIFLGYILHPPHLCTPGIKMGMIMTMTICKNLAA